MHRTRIHLALLPLIAGVLGGCSSVEGLISGDKIDYRSQAAKTQPLEVPPDLTQLARESRYQPQSGGTVSATTYQGGTGTQVALAVPAVPVVAPQSLGEMRVVRDGNERWLFVPMPADQLWPQVKAFWQERGFTIVNENVEAGVMETDWAENRAKIADDALRRTLGRLIDSFYSTGERDKFRTRLERTANGTEVYISHRGLEEVYVSQQRDQTTWTGRPNDPQLEAEFLQRLMAKLGAPAESARTAVANPVAPSATATAGAATAAGPGRARLAGGGVAALQVDEGFDRAWRRVGLALDRGGFTVEDRDRAGGLYYVRYVDPKLAAKEEPGFFSKLFSFGKDEGKDSLTGPGRYRIAVKSEGESTRVSVLDSKGAPENGEIGQRIVALLVDDLK